MDAKTFFTDKLPNIITSAPDKARELDAIYLFKVTGAAGGTWTVDAKTESPGVTEGDAGNAECTLEMEDSDFEAGLKDAQIFMQLYFQGKLKVSGNPMLATKLQQLFTMGG